MAHRIALFNHKGGVSKTTTTFNLGWMLAKRGHKVILVDTDPQCNLTGLILGYTGAEEFENFYETQPQRNIRDALAPAFESKPQLIRAVECVPVPRNENLLLLPGHIRLAEYEVTLGIAQQLSGSLETLQNLPGSFSYLFEKTADYHQADYILVDMSPSLGAINQNLLMTSDYFIVPTTPDYFSIMAINSLASILGKWTTWAENVQRFELFANATYPFPKMMPKFLGTVIQRYRIKYGVAASGFQRWSDKLTAAIDGSLIPMLIKHNMLLPTESYAELKGHQLASIQDFNSLITYSQEHHIPIFELTGKELGLATGPNKPKVEEFHEIFNEFAERVESLVTIGSSLQAI